MERAGLTKTPYPEQEAETREYNYFDSYESEVIFETAKTIGEYVAAKNIANIVFCDRSARAIYIGIKEYLKAKRPHVTPGMYFVNPRGMKPVNFTYLEDIPESQKELDLDRNEKSEIIAKVFENKFSKLVEENDKTVLIFDACIHSGRTVGILKNILTKVGFKKIKIGAVSSDVLIDIAVSRDREGCYPFGTQDEILRKNYDTVVTKLKGDCSDESFEKFGAIREEIKYIVNEGLKQESKDSF